jgi:undecaprenyl-diphosphatase
MVNIMHSDKEPLAAKPAGKTIILTTLFLGVLLPLGIFGRLADEVQEGKPLQLYEPILHFINLHATPALAPIVIFATHLVQLWTIVPEGLAIIATLTIRRRLRDAQFFTLSLTGVAILKLTAKLFFGRARPDLWLSPTPEFDYGFPSGHSMMTMAFAAALVAIVWPTKARWAMLVIGGLFVFAIGFTRLYLGVHYPSDVLGGWCASLAWVRGVHLIGSRPYRSPEDVELKNALFGGNSDGFHDIPGATPDTTA